MLNSDSSFCEHCADEENNDEEFKLHLKASVLLVSLSALVIGLFLETLPIYELWAYIAFFISTLVAGRWTIPKGLRGAAKLHLDVNFLMTFAAFGAFVIGAPTEGAIALLLYFIAETLEDAAEDRSRREISSLLELEPRNVTVKRDGNEINVLPEEVEIGELIIVRPGERIGLDGLVSAGTSSVNQSPITGESMPVLKESGNEVFAGTINQDGYLEITVTKISSETVLSRIASYVKEARLKRSNPERFVSRFTHIYTPSVVVISFLFTIFSFLLEATINTAVYRGLTLLVISCPCAFAISIPVSLISAITGSARDGTLVKGSTYIEKLSRASTVVFDKTGTLTKGTLSFETTCVHNGSSSNEVLAVAYSLEQKSEHPIAKAITEAALQSGLSVIPVDTFVSVPGHGVYGKGNGHEIIVGNRSLLEKHGVSLLNQEDHSCGQGTMVYVAKNGTHIGTILLSDSLRPSSNAALSELQEMGIYTVMLTGDSHSAAASVAEKLSIDDYRANLRPDGKVKFVEQLKDMGTVIMVGDGVNDAPALAASDTGIAMKAISSDIALETADIALMDDDLSKIPRLIRRSRKTLRIVRQNVAASISVKLFMAALALFGLVPLWAAVAIGDMGLSLAVIANALRLLTKR